MSDKASLRKTLRAARREHVAGLPASMLALMFSTPPSPLAGLLPPGSTVGLYQAVGDEAPTMGYAKWLHERGFALALPWFAGRGAAMEFRAWADPYDAGDLEAGLLGIPQPPHSAAPVIPQVCIVPLLGFTPACERIGQGAGHYDTWLAKHPDALAIGIAWDCQLVEELPLEPHDRRLDMIVSPTRVFERPDDAQ